MPYQTPSASPAPGPSEPIIGHGPMADLIRGRDWSTSPLGPIGDWSPILKAILGVGLNCSFPVCIYWGEDFHLLYNDAWSAIPGDKHPWALGRPAREAWSDIWPIIQPMFEGIMRTGAAVHTEDGMLPMQRLGYVEECYFNYNVSPIPGVDGRPVGLYNTVIETTTKVLGARRAHLLATLAEAGAQSETVDDFCQRAQPLLASAPADLPFALLYLVDPRQPGRLQRVVASGLPGDHPLAPEIIAPGDASSWPLAETQTRTGHTCTDLAQRAPGLVLPPWPEPVHSVQIQPLHEARGGATPMGYLVAGVSPRRALDGAYRTFLASLADSLALGVVQARAQEDSRLRTAALEQRIELRTQERDRLWSLSQDLLCVASPEGVLLSINPAWEDTLGWSEAELVGRTVHWLVHPDDLERTERERRSLAEGVRTRPFENRLRDKHGQYRWLAWRSTPGDRYIYSNARDVSEEKRTQDALKHAEEVLNQAQNMEALGQLTGGIAHDFNNLLAGVIGSLELIRRKLPPAARADVERLLDAASVSANRGAALTHNLVAFARRQTLALATVDLNELVRTQEDGLRRLLGPRTALVTRLAADLWPTRSDPHQLLRVLQHLIENARDAMPGGGRLLLETANLRVPQDAPPQEDAPPPGDYVLCKVCDSGSGMSADTLAHAFEPFFTTKTIGQGTGLGLSMVHGFVKQTGGHIRIHSEAGQGTRVALYLPRDTTMQERNDTPDSAPAADGSVKTILVVEDADIVRMLTVEVLEDLGYTVLQAADAQEALPILQGPQPLDLLMTDIGLPGMNGQQLAQAARQARPDLPVLFASGYAEIADIDGQLLTGGMEMIAKPFSIDLLREKVSGMLA
ncbi:ATP-binding protein [Pseudomonas mangiferae]|uniref:histidine kinase n=1 Tax=Pseudomonas mangiferae TaxID=2593654 RepID=A0A553H0J2_9PSED|nr:PAS domain-containing sensor histidine kinase [Pseudomonas mangiferae]TRX75253.1 response regulator [Pseudomonas mangiferae]